MNSHFKFSLNALFEFGIQITAAVIGIYFLVSALRWYQLLKLVHYEQTNIERVYVL
jgi:hypothetical protein